MATAGSVGGKQAVRRKNGLPEYRMGEVFVTTLWYLSDGDFQRLGGNSVYPRSTSEIRSWYGMEAVRAEQESGFLVARRVVGDLVGSIARHRRRTLTGACRSCTHKPKERKSLLTVGIMKNKGRTRPPTWNNDGRGETISRDAGLTRQSSLTGTPGYASGRLPGLCSRVWPRRILRS